MDWYKKNLELTKSVTKAFEQFKRFDDLYGKSFRKIAEDMLAQEEIIKKSITPFYSSFQNIISSLQPEIERIRELQLSSPILDVVNQANVELSTIFAGQSSLLKLAEEARTLSHYWRMEIESAKVLASGTEAAKLALNSHFDSIAQASLLAQERLLNSQWQNLEKSILNKTNELSTAIHSFKNFTESYSLLIQSFKNEKSSVVDFPPFVSGLPPIEILTGSDLLDSISRDYTEFDTEDYVEEADALEIEIREDIETSLDDLLAHIDPEIKRLWHGAKHALTSKNPDKKRHVVVSLREMLTHVLHAIAPDSEVSKWTSKPNHFHKGRPTREARLLYICRAINHGPFEQFMNKDVDAHVKFIRLFQRGTHELDINFTEQQLRTLVVRTEALVRFLVITWNNTK